MACTPDTPNPSPAPDTPPSSNTVNNETDKPYEGPQLATGIKLYDFRGKGSPVLMQGTAQTIGNAVATAIYPKFKDKKPKINIYLTNTNTQSGDVSKIQKFKKDMGDSKTIALVQINATDGSAVVDVHGHELGKAENSGIRKGIKGILGSL